MKEAPQPIQRNQFLELLESKLSTVRTQLNYLEEIREAIEEAETTGKIVHFYQDGDTIRYEVKNKPPIGFNGT